MRIRAKLMAAAIGLLMALPSVADAQSACGTYRVERGDTLYNISQRAYGFDNVRRVYRANARVIGRNPNVIEVGTLLRLPCTRGARAPSAAGRVVSFVTATGFAPYLDERASEGGILAELVRTAMRRGGQGAEAEIVFVNDRGAHLEHLLPRGAFDGSFPWPACAGECGGYLYSEPFYEATEGFFAGVDSPLLEALDAADLADTLVCRPDGMPPAAVEASHGAPDVEGCFALLADGTVDLVSVDTRAGDRALAGMGMAGAVAANPHIVDIVPLAVAVPSAQADAPAILETLNRGLAEMLRSGEWDSIVSRGLGARDGAMTN